VKTTIKDLRSPEIAPPMSVGDRMVMAIRSATASQIAVNRDYPKDPVQFQREVLGIDPWWGQEDITRAVWEHQYTSVASCHGIGKTFITAAIGITFLHCFENSIVLSTAPTGRQVEHVLWRNIRAIHRRAKVPLLGAKPLTTRYDIAEDWYAMGFKPSDQETDPTQGFHAENILVIIDEGAGVPTMLIDGLQAAMTTENSRMLMIGNPTSTSGPFYDSHHSARDLYHTMVYAWEDTPNFLMPGQTRWKGLITEQWVNNTIRKYGIESPYVQSRVYARWVSAEGVMISVAMIEAAKNRGFDDGMYAGFPQEAGLDVARDGNDRSALTLRAGAQVVGSWPVPGNESWQTVGATLDLISKHQPETTRIKVDIIGLGVGVYDVMRHVVKERGMNLRVVGVNFSKVPHDKEKYINQRSESYGLLADRFRNGDIFGTIVPEVEADLSALQGRIDGRHTQPVVEPKDDFRKRTGRSSDFGDSIALAFYDPPPDEVKPIGVISTGYATAKWGRL
jgi:hypothetical protein